MVHYQGATTHEEFCMAFETIADQTFQDFELLIYHNGPFLDGKLKEFPHPIFCSETNTGDWGIDNRNRALQVAQGDYVLFTNSDNIHYPNMLEEIDKTIKEPQLGRSDTDNVIIYPIILRDHINFFGSMVRTPKDSGPHMILTGNPPGEGLIDGMQFVTKREILLQHGGWFKKSPTCDGWLAKFYAMHYGYRVVNKILGEHR